MANQVPLYDLDRDFRQVLDEAPAALQRDFARILSRGPLPLEGTEITEAILLRLGSYCRAQRQIVGFLDKQYRAAAADFFVESVVFYLKGLNESHSLRLEITSERQIRRRRGAPRPDITVWKKQSMIAAIECKTQLGRNRDGWEADFLDREQQLHKDFPDAQVYLVVLTSINWGGFAGHPKCGSQFFQLSNRWPTDLLRQDVRQAIDIPIEPLFRAIRDAAGAP